MTITLGGVTLNSHLSWQKRWDTSEVSGEEATTLGGRSVFTRGPESLQDIVLECIEEDNIRKGYFTQSQLESLIVFRDAGTTIILSYHSESSIAVGIRLNGINVKKTLWNSEFTDEDRYVGTITLKRV
jgi:hypothetical protein